MGRPKKYTKSDYIDALKKSAEILDKSPTVSEYDSLDISPSSKQIRTVFNGWNNAKEEANLDTHISSRLSKSGGPPDILNISNTEWENMSRNKRLKKRKRAKWANEKLNHGCKMCGYDEHPAALEWHHTRDKTNSISQMINHTKGEDAIQREVEKCIVLCTNCHKIETFSDTYNV